jgi:hypothetical protein
MMSSPSPSAPQLSGRRLALALGGSSLVAGAVLVAFILPAEFDIDPLGIGKATGLSRLWAPDEQRYSGPISSSYASAGPAVRHRVSIPLGAAGWPEAALEYKVAMRSGQGMIYSWSATNAATGTAADVRFEFHGHTLEADAAMTVADYEKARASKADGSLTAPFDGIHGWYFENLGDNPVTVDVVIEGFFDIIPPGAPGNEFRIRPVADDQSLK